MMPYRRCTLFISFLVVVAGFVLPPAYGRPGAVGGGEPGASAHEFHVSYGRMAIEGNLALLQIRLFKDDLEQALQRKYAVPDFHLEVNALSDSLFTAYFNEVFVLNQGDTQVRGAIVSSGEEQMGREAMWWYTIRFDAPASLDAFTVRHVVLLEEFDDQKNIFKVRHFPSDKEQSYYFTEGAEEYRIAF